MDINDHLMTRVIMQIDLLEVIDLDFEDDL